MLFIKYYEIKTYVMRFIEKVFMRKKYKQGEALKDILIGASQVKDLKDMMKLLKKQIKYKADKFPDYSSSLPITIERGYGDCDDMSQAIYEIYGNVIEHNETFYYYDSFWTFTKGKVGHAMCVYKRILPTESVYSEDSKYEYLIFDNFNLKVVRYNILNDYLNAKNKKSKIGTHYYRLFTKEV